MMSQSFRGVANVCAMPACGRYGFGAAASGGGIDSHNSAQWSLFAPLFTYFLRNAAANCAVGRLHLCGCDVSAEFHGNFAYLLEENAF
jgi:hypothetical protein